MPSKRKRSKISKIDTRGIASRVCFNCGGDTFKVLIRLDPESFEIGWYTLNGYCASCEAPVSIPAPKSEVSALDFAD